MDGDDRLEVRVGDAAGTLTGLVLGGLVLLVDAPRATGSGDNPAVWVFGLPAFRPLQAP